MKQFLGKLFLLTAFFLCMMQVFVFPARAQTATQSSQTAITVTVAGTSVSISGYIAPFASVVLTVNGNILGSVVADSKGNFSFSNVIAPKATSTLCLTAEDFKKLGTSEACISVTPTNGVIAKTGVFVPPTLGVQRTNVYVGNDAIAFGYGMPGAQITVHINDDMGCTVTAQTTGYYTCAIIIKTTGNNTLFADATLLGKPSEKQLQKVLIQGISLVKPSAVPTLGFLLTPAPALPGFAQLLAIPWWMWILLALVVIILLIILLRKFRPEAIPAVGIPSVPMGRFAHIFDKVFRSRKLHHAWMKGVGF